MTYVFSSAPKRLGALFLCPAVAYGAKICYIYLIGVMHMRILGVDPGIATVGFAVLDAEKRSQRLLTCGVITTPAKTQLSSRLDQIYRDLNELIAQFHPEVMAVEELFSIRISRPASPLPMAAASSCSRAIRPGCRSMNTRRCRSSRRSSVMAVRTKAGHGHGAPHPVPAGRAEAGRRGGRRRHRALPCAQRHIFDPSTGEI